MAKQLNINLAFTADTSQAKAQLQSLQTSLKQLISSAQLQDQGLGISKELQHSITLSSQLKSLLASATNMETGKLDLGKFNEGLQKSGTNLQTYSNALNSLGVQGQQAFSQLASSILQAELPLKRSNALLGQFMTTLKNTARWQISSSLLHGFVGTVKSAYGYAQDLNESLNNIRIVTGQNIDQMAKFAEKANQVAKALSTSTTEYTNASLIYYQQGLSDSEVQERTNVTIKMANVSRQSAEIVSDQMTAVWNNFYDGGKSLEYYADVMTALGAATASSSDEIAGGLEKFAAIGETIGLSYEYAASALATITANTRQSEEVVGTALKTIFARIQGLKLGETLEDGVELNKYSEALQTVGISIFEQNGELKKMDNILNEMGAKWDTLSKAQQTALAQTVAGVRQYNQLISLMDNWDDMQKNLDISYNAEGALQEQADTYAESWEAASKRVKASAEGIYQTLLNDKFFIGVNNAFAELLQLIDNTIDSFGGLPGVLFMLGSVITSVFGTQITQSFDNFIYRIKMSTEVGKQSILQLRQQANDLLITNNVDMASTSGNAAANAYRQQGVVQNELIAKAEQLSEIERQQAQYLLDGHSSLVQQTVDLGILVEQEERRAIQIERSVMASARSAASQRYQGQADEIKRVNQAAIDAKNQLKNLEEAYYQLSTIPTFENIEQIDTNSMQRLLNIIKELEQEYGDLNLKINDTKWGKSFGTGTAGIFRELKNSIEDGSITAEKFSLIMDKLATSSHTKIRRLAQVFVECGMSEEEAAREAQRLAAQYDNLGDRTAELTESQIRLNNATNNFQNFLQKTKGAVQTFGSAVTVGINALSSFGMMMMSIKGIVDTLNNTEMSFGDKFITIFTQMTFLLPSVLHTVTQLTTLFGPQGFIGSITLANSVLGQYGTQLGASISSINLMILAKKAEKGAIDEATTARLLEKIMIKTGCNEKKAEQILEAMLTKGKHLLNAATAKEIALEIAKKAIKAATNSIMLATVAITAALTAAVWAFVYASQAEERALQAAKESVDNTARAYEDAENAVTKFKETASNYTEAIKGMKDLAYGTAEYTEKLREANDAAIELIKNNPELEYDVQGGLIQFKDGMNALESLEKQLMNRTYNAKMFNINAEIEYENLLKPGKIESELEKLDVLKNEWKDIPALRGMGNEFIKKLGSVNEAEKQGILNSNEAIKNILKDSGWETPGYSNSIDEFVKRINNLTPAEKQDLINLSTEINKNTVALQAETAAILQEEYGQENVDQYGGAEVYATKSAILDERASTAWIHEDHKNKKVGFAEYLDDDLNWGNNISNLSKENQELLAKVMGKSVEDIINGEIRISNDKVEVSTGKDASNTMLPSMSVEDFNKAALNAAGQATVTWEEISAKLDTEKGRLEAQQQAKESGLYSADDLTIYDEFSSFKGLTYGTAKALETKFSDENGEISGAINKYFDGLDNTVKKQAAERLLQLDSTNLNVEQLDSTVKEITEKEAQQYREQQVKAELQTDSAKYELDYSITEKQMERVKETLQDYNKELEKNGKLGETVEKKGNELSTGYSNLEKSSKDLTVANQRMNRGIATLGDNFEDWSKVLKTGDKTTLEYTEAMEGMKEAFADIYNISDSSLISDDFIENMDPAIMQQIADGNIEAIESMRMAMADDIVANIILNNNLTTAEGDTVTSLWSQAKAELDAMGDLTVGTHIEGTSDFVARLNDLIESAGMTKDQVNSLLGSMGMSATLKTRYEETEMEVPTWVEHVIPQTPVTVQQGEDADGDPNEVTYTPVKKYSVPGEPMKVFGMQEVVSIETEAADGTSSGGGIDVIGSGKPSPSNTGRTSGGGGGGGGGSSSSAPKKNKRQRTTRKIDIVKPYEQLEKQLDKVNDEIDDVSNSLDGLYGNARLKALDKYNEGLGKQIKALEKVRAEGKFHKENAKKELIDFVNTEFNYDGTGGLAGILGIPLEFDADGNIANLDRIRTTYWEERKEMEDHMNTLKTDEERQAYKEQFYDPLVDTFDWLEELIVAYDEANEKIKETEDAIKDARKEIQANNYEKITYAIDLELEINELDLQKLELLLEKYMRINSTVFDTKDLGANFNKITNNLQMQMIESIQNAEVAEREIADALEQLNSNKIDMKQYVELTDKSAQVIVDSYQSALDTINTLFDALSDRISLAFDKINQFFGEFDHINAILDHKLNIDKLANGEEGNLSNQIKLVQTQQNVLQSTIASYENALPVLDSMRSSLEAEIAAMKASNTDGQYDEYIARLEEQLDSTVEEINSNKEVLASAIEEWGELITQELELTLTKIRKQFERNMFSEGSADAAQEAIERLNASQEEMLTTTNKIYETNKLIRDIENEMDKTNNKRAKQQLAAFAQQIEQKQKSEKLSKFELELAQADYEILKAKIALEEAQQAKSTVRLRRDSEGNYGYVYTADENNIAEAEQKLADAQNNRYNIALEGAQNYSEKILQTEIDLTNTLADLEEQRISGAITESEWEQKVAEATEYYTNLRAEAQKLYGIAVETMTEEAAENTEDYTTRAGQSMDNFTMNVNRYVQQQKSAFDSYDAKLTQVTKSSEKNFGTMEKAMDYARESADSLQDKFVKELVPAITNTVIPAIQGLNKELAELIRLMAEAGLEDMAIESLDKAAKIRKAVATDWSKEDGGYASGIIALVEQGVGYFSEEMQDILNDRFYKVITDNKLGYDDTDYSALIKEAEGDLVKQRALMYMQKYAVLNYEDWAELSNNTIDEAKKQQYEAYSNAKAGKSTSDDEKKYNVDKDTVWSTNDLWHQIKTDYEIDGTTDTYTTKNAITALLAREGIEQKDIAWYLGELDKKLHQEAEGYQTSMNAADNIPVLESKYEATGNIERDIYKFLEAQGLTKAGIAGLMGNLVAESDLEPSNLQDDYEKSLGHTDSSYTQAVDKGTYNNFVGDNAGYGLAQWTSSDRKQGLLNLAKERKTSIGDLETQLLFLMQELKQSHPEVLKVLKTTNDIREATAIVLRQFERPKDQSDGAVSKRMANGEKYLNFNTEWAHPLGGASYEKGEGYYDRNGTHLGVDLKAPADTAVYAVKGGTVHNMSDLKVGGYGRYVWVEHDDGTGAYYGHTRWYLPDGSHVDQGKKVAEIAKTKEYSAVEGSSGPHLEICILDSKGKKIDPEQFISLDTGGYTGAWGPEGKLAMLHEKEIVLNKRDTENFLDSVAMLREVSRQIDINAMIASLGALPLSALTIDDTADKILQQEVTIHADFPNVQDHNEIELAIDNLINAASQYAYKR